MQEEPGVLVELVESVLAMPGEFLTVATNDPLAAVMLLVGSVLVLVSMGVFGYLTAGALASLVTPAPRGRSHP